MKNMHKIAFILLLFIPNLIFSQATTVKFAVMKYDGGGDWYSNPTSLPNLIAFCNQNIKPQ